MSDSYKGLSPVGLSDNGSFSSSIADFSFMTASLGFRENFTLTPCF